MELKMFFIQKKVKSFTQKMTIKRKIRFLYKNLFGNNSNYANKIYFQIR